MRRRGIECFRPDTMRGVERSGAARDASKLAIKSPREDDSILDDVGGAAGRGPSLSAGRLSAFPRRHSGQVGSLRQPLAASSRRCIPFEGCPHVVLASVGYMATGKNNKNLKAVFTTSVLYRKNTHKDLTAVLPKILMEICHFFTIFLVLNKPRYFL